MDQKPVPKLHSLLLRLKGRRASDNSQPALMATVTVQLRLGNITSRLRGQ